MLTDDFKMLADRILAFAKSALVEDGFLLPISAAISLDGDFVPVKRIQPPGENDTAPGIVNEILGVLRRIARNKDVPPSRPHPPPFDRRPLPFGAR